ncbi:MAG: HEAT repeat domain-containing protein [Bdellovibrionota bacterium]|nr:HEAT repeat domain-containing protein [Bdellovibrionota bacterium]
MEKLDEIFELIQSNDFAIKRVGLEELAELSDPSHLDYFLENLHSADKGVQEVCVDHLIYLKSPNSVPSLVENLKSENVPLRNSSFEVLSFISHEAVDQIINNLWIHDNDVDKFLLDALIYNHRKINLTERHAEIIHKGFDIENENIVGAVVELLAILNTEESWNVLREKCKIQNGWIQFAILSYMDKINPDQLDLVKNEMLDSYATEEAKIFFKMKGVA